MIMIVKIKPLSVNQAWQGKRYKSKRYKEFERAMLLMLPPVKIDLKGNLRVNVTFGFSTSASDIDNPLKPLLDCLQKKYKINDNRIYELNVKKEIVKKGNEFIQLSINEI